MKAATIRIRTLADYSIWLKDRQQPTQTGAGGRRPVTDLATLLNSGSCRLRFLNLSVKNTREPINHLVPGRNMVVDLNAIVLTKLDLVSPTVRANYHGFMIGFKRGVAHRSEEHWNVRDTRIYTGVGGT
jgi:hypothetical protein